MKAGELTEKEAEAMMVTFRKEAGVRDKNDTDYRAIAKRPNNLRRHHSCRCRGSPRLHRATLSGKSIQWDSKNAQIVNESDPKVSPPQIPPRVGAITAHLKKYNGTVLKPPSTVLGWGRGIGRFRRL